ncbi:MAG: NADAR family protein [Prevotella sp.]|nr:NADAR family protein [Alistipes senegalensis]MCM1358516.1 NADAR family protein [Prevotella sp.]MCM1473664.1 NADAR family protein [Muribaculaceae bacterium]
MKYSVKNVCERFNKKEKLKYVFFWGHTPSPDGTLTKTCFSQWYACKFTVDGIEYSTAEQYMMSQKALLFGDAEINKEIMSAKHPKQFKALGRKIRNFNEKIWNDNKTDIVIRGNYAKFSQNPEFKEFLLKTGNRIIVEASPYDKIWGIGMPANSSGIENPTTWNGENLLGFCLMEVRDMLQEEHKND